MKKHFLISIVVGVGMVLALVFFWQNATKKHPVETAATEDSLSEDAPGVSEGWILGGDPVVQKAPESTQPDVAEVMPVVEADVIDLAPIGEPADPSSGDLVALIVNQGSASERTEAALSLAHGSLNQGGFNTLRDYLLQPQSGKDRDFRQYEYGLRNYIMNALALDPHRTSEAISAFSEIYQDEAQGDILRGYALQHLAMVYMEHGADLSGGDTTRMLAVFEEAVANRSHGTLASTALVCMHEVSMLDASVIPPARVRRAAMNLLQDPVSGFMSRISALQISAETGIREAVPYARDYAFDASRNWGLRVSAVYALGELDGARGLEALLKDSDKHVQTAALAALKK